MLLLTCRRRQPHGAFPDYLCHHSPLAQNDQLVLRLISAVELGDLAVKLLTSLNLCFHTASFSRQTVLLHAGGTSVSDM